MRIFEEYNRIGLSGKHSESFYTFTFKMLELLDYFVHDSLKKFEGKDAIDYYSFLLIKNYQTKYNLGSLEMFPSEESTYFDILISKNTLIREITMNILNEHKDDI